MRSRSVSAKTESFDLGIDLDFDLNFDVSKEATTNEYSSEVRFAGWLFDNRWRDARLIVRLPRVAAW